MMEVDMTNSDPLQPELLEKMWAVYYHKYQGRQKKKTFISNATELIKLMDIAISDGGISEALQFWADKYKIKDDYIGQYFHSISDVTTLS
jgi:hypothetical protein